MRDLVEKWEEELVSVNILIEEYKQNDEGNEETFNEILERKWLIERVIADIKTIANVRG